MKVAFPLAVVLALLLFVFSVAGMPGAVLGQAWADAFEWPPPDGEVRALFDSSRSYFEEMRELPDTIEGNFGIGLDVLWVTGHAYVKEEQHWSDWGGDHTYSTDEVLARLGIAAAGYERHTQLQKLAGIKKTRRWGRSLRFLVGGDSNTFACSLKWIVWQPDPPATILATTDKPEKSGDWYARLEGNWYIVHQFD